MKGLELSEAFYEEYGRPMLENQFPDLLPYLAVGLFGSGSECFGFDDEISRDHDFEPGFCLFLPDEETVDRRSAFLLERAYAKLPRSFRGFQRSVILPVGGARHGVFRTSEFFMKTAGTSDGELSLEQWLTIPEEALAEATNGKVFFDNYGEVTAIRRSLAAFPEDIRLKRLAGNLLLMAQAGQYNYPRCLGHGEPAAAQMAVYEFVKSTLTTVFLLNGRYQPYYKWVFRAMRVLPALSELVDPLESLLTTDNRAETIPAKTQSIEDISASIAQRLKEMELSRVGGQELERHAYSVNDRIQNAELRNMHILSAV